MLHPYILPRDCNVIAVASLRIHSQSPPLKTSDPAIRAMTDFRRDPILTVTEESALEHVLDEMFRLGVRAFLVARERVLTGLVTAEHARGGHAPISGGLRVADVMTPSSDVPAVDWHTVEHAQIRDLIEIFEGSGVQHLVVLENETSDLSSVRGLIHRHRLERQLGSRWEMSAGVVNRTAS